MKKGGIPETVLQVNWIHPKPIESWLRKMALGKTLNVCCGNSLVGDVRIDTDPNTERTHAGDLFSLPYTAFSFDTVICDPPFRYFHKFGWVNDLSKIAKKRFLISADRTIIRLPREIWKTRLFAFQLTESAMYLRLYYCFDRINEFVLIE